MVIISNRRIGKRWAISLVMAMLVIATSTTGCDPNTARTLAQASQTVSIGLDNAQDALIQAVQSGLVDASTATAVDAQFKRVAQAGLTLNSTIRANLATPDVETELDNLITAFEALVNDGVARIQNPATKLAISTALNSARAGLAIIAAEVRR